MEAIVLAGGLGTRLRSVVADLPKCMASVANRPFLYYVLRYLEREGVKHVILSLGYLHEVIEEWMASETWSFDYSVSIEDEPLGTGGAIQKAMEQSRYDHTFVMNGDTYFDVPLHEMHQQHIARKADLTIALKQMVEFDRYGTVTLNDERRIVGFEEKRQCAAGLINGGTYLINKSTAVYSSSMPKYSFEKVVLEGRVATARFEGFVCNGYFIDIGIPEDFSKANVDFLAPQFQS